MSLRDDALEIISAAIKASDPKESTRRILSGLLLPGEVTAFSFGKAAVPMAQAASEVFGERIKTGFAVTKYGHTGAFSSPFFEVVEAAHPISDENSVSAAERALEVACGLGKNDTAVVLLSGGASALLEKSLVPADVQREVTRKLLSRGAAIDEINAVRKRLSLIKGGKFAAACYPARVITVALSDVLNDDKSVIGSGLTVADETPDDFIKNAYEKYLYDVSFIEKILFADREPLRINDGGYYFAGNVGMLCSAAVKKAEDLGYKTVCLTQELTGEAREQPEKLLKKTASGNGKRAYICGGETTVTLNGNGLGGRNQEMALAAAIEIRGKSGVVFASAGSDGTDGPTDAAGGIADGGTCSRMTAAGLDPAEELENNDSHNALSAAGDLIVTGPTGTNVNDITLILYG